MIRTSLALAFAATLAALAPAPSAQAAESLTLGVFLPQATFATNAERSAYAQGLAARLGEELGVEVTARVFARRDDVIAFIAARRVDLLVSDGLALLGRGEEVLAHATGSPAAALYAAPDTTVMDLAGATVALAEVGTGDARFYGNAALAGEVSPERWFGAMREAKDAAAALDAVKARAARAAFAPAGHPNASGLVVVAQGGAVPLAVMALTNPARVTPAQRAQIVAALGGGAGVGGGIAGWAPGRGAALDRALSDARSAPRFLTTPPLLTPAPPRRIAPPAIRLSTRGALAPPEIGTQHAVIPTLPDE